MEAYLRIVDDILKNGVNKGNRTGVDTKAIAGTMFEHEMSEGFPLLTTKEVSFKRVASELEFFIKGLTDKKWLQDRDNHIWDAWCTSEKVEYAHDDETKQKMKEERDLGPVYGFQWRHFGAKYEGYDQDYTKKGIDQLEKLVNTLSEKPEDRRMIVSAWNPADIDKMALPACHYGFQVTVIDGKLNLQWNQRSVDTALGLPYNVASYGLLLHLLAKESGLEEGRLTGALMDTHIYENHFEGLATQLSRKPFELPSLETDNFTSIFDWTYKDSKVVGYEKHPSIKFEVAV
ncbi:thymidylate synthase [Candidatus Woesearchaeota archaeon]|jgi:thymidylate synthase|nr:thymidylate synthase [Candidatus Woesearchaeota archaeon]MBT4577432.1 thymidylate synthase [Candidatus Woesearchaeota archaeon]MBT5215614.1 thymidylate synthase [Candidatus Woesearchaeota archaeon]MBT6401959.1 thymidylate synthase [Candidatus Woesearchaeota archaeon]